ncbi:unnamed protein product [Trichobilharzia regenti]|nr:unnamed protein product [Trichobilharzia regenti]
MAYLNSAQEKLDKFSREPGQTSNKEVQRLVASIFYCLNLVSLQYITPCFLSLCLLCLHKNLSGLSWLPCQYFQPSLSSNSTTLPVAVVSNAQNLTNLSSSIFFLTISQNNVTSWPSMFIQARYIINQIMDSFILRGMTISHGIFGFLLWWTLLSWQSMSLLGLAYHRFASND